MKYTIAGAHVSVEIDPDMGVRFSEASSDLGRRILGEYGGLTNIHSASVDEIKEAASLIIAVCDVFSDLQKGAISVNHAIGVIGNALLLFDNSVPEPVRPTTLIR